MLNTFYYFQHNIIIRNIRFNYDYNFSIKNALSEWPFSSAFLFTLNQMAHILCGKLLSIFIIT